MGEGQGEGTSTSADTLSRLSSSRPGSLATRARRVHLFALLLVQQFESREGPAVASAVADRNKDPSSSLGGINDLEPRAGDAGGKTVDLGEGSIQRLGHIEE